MTFKIDSLLSKKVSELDAEKVGFTRESCTGFGVNSKGCIFWQKDSIISLQKVDLREYPIAELILYRSIEIRSDFFFSNLYSKERCPCKRNGGKTFSSSSR